MVMMVVGGGRVVVGRIVCTEGGGGGGFGDHSKIPQHEFNTLTSILETTEVYSTFSDP